MIYCKKCGSKLKEGDNFCEQCGYPIPHASQENDQETVVQYNNSNNDMSSSFKNVLNYIIEVIKQPVNAVEKCNEKISKRESYVLLVLLSLIYGLISVIYIKTVASKINSIIYKIQSFIQAFTGDLEFDIASLYNDFSQYTNIKVPKITSKISYEKIFIYQFFIFFFTVVILFVCCYFILKLLSKLDIKPLVVFKVAVTSFIPLMFYITLKWICGYILPSFSIIFLILGIVLAVITLYKGLESYIGKYYKNSAYIAAWSYVLLILIQEVIGKLWIKNFISKIKLW